MGIKKVKYNKAAINQLPDNMPVTYEILNRSGNLNYVGKAKRGNVRKEISSYLNKIPGDTVKIQQFHRLRDAEKKEANVIKRSQPLYNKLGK